MEARRITIVRNGREEVIEFDAPPGVLPLVELERRPRPRRRRLQLMPALFVVMAAATLAVLAGLILFVR